jgi:hypothetical protein
MQQVVMECQKEHDFDKKDSIARATSLLEERLNKDFDAKMVQTQSESKTRKLNTNTSTPRCFSLCNAVCFVNNGMRKTAL